MRLRRALGRLIQLVAVALVVTLVGAVALVAALTARGLPQTSGTIRVGVLHHPVTIVRDLAGIVQITADDPHDLFVAQGFVHAQERMWQMEVSRHIALGRLSELFGRASLDTDRFVRTLDWPGSAKRDLDALPDDTRAALEAYSAGVNAWIDAHAGAMSLPFVFAGLAARAGLGGYTPEHWTPLDSVAWQKVQAWSLGGNMNEELFRMLADAKVGDPAKVDELFPAYDSSMPVITPSEILATNGGTAAASAVPGRGATASGVSGGTPEEGRGGTHAPTTETAADTQLSAWRELADVGGTVARLAGFDVGDGLAGDRGVGSNNWVVSGSKTASGGALLANDPHLGFSMPSVWIVNGLHCRTVGTACPWDATGVSFPGVPAIVLGHNARIAWGATNVGPDVEDLFRETVDPADSTHYLWKGQSLPFDIRHETIRVAGAAPVEIAVRSTIHGPVLNDVSDRLADEPVTTLRWTTLVETDGTLNSIFHLGLARDFASFRAAFKGYGAPSQNFVYADVDGHIGYVLPGLIPVRAGTRTGDRIRDGAGGTQEWTGYIPFDRLPWQYDPPTGVIVSANNAAVDARYPYYIADDWDPGWRAKRIAERLAALPPKTITTADLRAIETDTHPLRADTIIPLVEGLAGEPSTADGRAVRDRIAEWDRTCEIESTGCAAYATFELMLTRAIVDDELGPLARDYLGQPPSWGTLIALLHDPDNAWWDDVSTPGRERAPEVIARAFDAAGGALRGALGDPSRWTWGRIHTISFREQTLGTSGIGLLEWYFDAAPRPLAGVSGAVDNMYYRPSRMYPDPYDSTFTPVGVAHVFDVTNGPSYRLTIDMSALDDARIVITTGQSGNPFDRHYGDMIDAWATGGTFPLPFSPAAVAKSAAATLTLAP